MKLPTKPKTNTPPTLPELEAKRSELTARLVEVTAQADALDPLADWERAGSVAAQQTALQNALDALDAQLVTARRLADEEARAAAEAAMHERKVQALAGARTAARATVDVLRHFDKTVLADLDAAVMELAHAGGYLPPEVAHVVNLRGAVTRTLALVGDAQPDWLGLPPKPTAKETAVYEARQALERAERRLADLGKMQARGQRWQDLVGEAEANVKRAQEKVSSLTGESFVLSSLGAKVASMARYIDPPRDEVLA